MILCITEKPSVGHDIARILGASARHEGYFEGNGYCVTWTFGHLCCLKEPHDYTPDWKRWNLSSLPMLPQRFGIKLINDKGIENQFNIIKTLIEKCDEVINCGDAGQEGELIQRWVMQKAGCDKPVKRLWISSLTDDSIRDGFSNLKEAASYDNLYTAGLCRAIGDWVLGINATRLYTLRYSNNRNILSIGRVQTPTLALIVNRQREIENFVPKDFWELKTRYRNVVFNASGKGFDDKQKAIAAQEKTTGSLLHILDVAKKKGKEAPPRLFDLTSLQVECNKTLSLSADDTLKTVQSLYEKKVTTYPRVDTTYLTEDMYRKCGPILNSLTEFKDLLTPLRGKPLKKSQKIFDNSKVTDHHAIIPTGQKPSGLTPCETDVFNIIARRFIAAFYPDFEFEQTIVSAQAGGIAFKATGRIAIKSGWKDVYARKEITDDKNESSDLQILPAFTPGEEGPHEPFLAKKTTSPPKYYTEGTLLKAMETAGADIEDEALRESLKANGIGRPSTRAAIIELLYRRGYIVRERKSLRATPAAYELIDTIKEELLKSAELTGLWERRLREIEKGNINAQAFINDIKTLIVDITKSVFSDTSSKRITTEQAEAGKNSSEKKKTPAKKKSANG